MTDVWDQFPDPPKPMGGDPWAQFPDHDGVSKAMRRAPDESAQPRQQQSTSQRREQSSVSSAADVAKSAGIGLAQGGIALATLPGNLEALARLGIDSAAEGLGYNSPGLSGHTVLPTASDAQGFIEKYTGPFYQPQTTAGEYARTVGEFAPMAAIGAGGAVSRAVNVLAPAITSETLGQATKGTSAEPWARAGGALIGGMLPNAAMRAVTPITSDAGRAAQVALLEQNGVNALTAGQRTGNSAVRWVESAAHDIPFSGGRGKILNDQAAEQFTRAALQRAGINADRATADVIDQGFTTLGNQFEALAQRNIMNVDNPLRAEVHQALAAYERSTPPSLRAPIIDELQNDIFNIPNNILTGGQYQAWRSQIERVRRGAQQTNPHLAEALSDIRDALDDAMTRSSSQADAAAWRQVRGQYRNLLTIEKAASGAGENTALGLISPSQLRTAVKSQSQRAYVRGQRDIGNLAKAGEAIMKPLPNSGTPARLAAQHMAAAVGGAAGMGVANLPGAVAGALAPGTMARTMMSAPIQRYLSNQALAPVIDAYEPVNAIFRVPQAAAITQQPSLRGGMGPRYDESGNLLPSY